MSDKSNLPRGKSRPLKNRAFVISAIILAVLGCIFGLRYYFYALSHVSTDDAFIEGHAVSISPKISGHILKVYVDDNQQVKAGELLVEIDPRDYKIRYEMANANLKAAQAKADQANEDVSRYEKLTLNDEISKQDMGHALVKARIADAERDQAKAALDQAKLQLSYTKICAPAAGRVTEKSVEEGAFVQIGQMLLAIVTPERWVVANLKETDLKDIAPGQPVSIKIDAYPGKKFKGHVESIQRGTGAKFSLLPPENATGNYVKIVQRVPVKIVFDEKPGPRYPLALGMSVIPTIKTK